MPEYFTYFFEHPRQISSVLSVAVLWFSFAALARLAGAGGRFPELAPVIGWAVASTAMTLVGVYTDISLEYAAIGLAVLTVFVFAASARRDPWVIPIGFLKAICFAAPLLLLVSAAIGSQWDEFADWLITPKYLLLYGVMPGLGHPPSGATLSAYPFGWHFVTYFASVIGGRLIENTGALVNVLLLLSLGHAAVRLSMGNVTGALPTHPLSWRHAAFAVAAATLINPAFVQKVILTSYADVATSVSLAVAAIYGWMMLKDLAEGDARAARRSAWLMSLVLMLLVNLKQSTGELFGLLLIALAIAGLCDPRVRIRPLFTHLFAAALPGLIIYFVWRGYVTAELTGQEFSIRPLADWHWDLLPKILSGAVYVLLKKSYYTVLMLGAVVAGVLAVRRCRSTFDHMAITIGVVFLGHVTFLLVMYLAAFGKFEAERVASFWRYNQQLSGLGICFAASCLGLAWHRWGGALDTRGVSAKRLGLFAMCLVLLAPIVFAEKLRFDALPYVRHYRTVAVEAAPLIRAEDKVHIFDPKGTGESAIIFRYEGVPLGKPVNFTSAFSNSSEAQVRDLIEDFGHGVILVHSATPSVIAVLGDRFTADHSYLLRLHEDGRIDEIKSWPYPEGFHKR